MGITVAPIAGGAVLFLMSIYGDNLQLPPDEPSPKVDISPSETEEAPSPRLEEATTETEENQTATPPE